MFLESKKDKFPNIQTKVIDEFNVLIGKDAQSNDIIIPFSNFSKISCDSNGNYINLNLSNWEADRTYKIEFKVTIDGNTQYFDNDITFRIVKN